MTRFRQEYLDRFLAAWREWESRPRIACPHCWFESPVVGPESHAPGCQPSDCCGDPSAHGD